MLKSGKITVVMAAYLVLGVAVGIAGPKPPATSAGAPAAGGINSPPQKQTGTPTANRVAAGEVYAKKLLVLMDTDKNGKVSKKEWMDFMSKEFDALDVNRDGELDVKELAKFHEPASVGK